MLTENVRRVGRVSRLVFGCASVGGRVSRRASLRAMAAAFSGGVTTFDVARSYGYGEAESILGQFLKGRRQQAQIVTKAGIAPNTSRTVRVAKSMARAVFAVVPGARGLAKPALGKQRSAGHFGPAELEASLVVSLRALGTDYVDAFLLHACDRDVVERDEVFEAMNRFIARGMTRRVGVASGVGEAVRWLERGGDSAVELSVREQVLLPEALIPIELLLTNQPLDGGDLLRSVEHSCQARGLDRRVALELLLHRPLERGATGVVMSMLSVQHVEQALAALNDPHLSPVERRELSSEILVES